ncbi:MAG: D-aminoacyl-tRNA deacylase [Thermomicrobiales bacterium]
MQRVSSASVTVEDKTVGSIGEGLLLLVGIGEGDGEAEADYLANKIANLRIFSDESGRMNLSLLDVRGAALVVSQFTLFANVRKGRRPSFTGAAAPEEAVPLLDHFVTLLKDLDVPVEQGEFGAMMQVELVNDGPVTIWLDTSELIE